MVPDLREAGAADQADITASNDGYSHRKTDQLKMEPAFYLNEAEMIVLLLKCDIIDTL